ncbi:MAG: V-type ATP synthase subunit D [Candidatus Bathyarchaeia archaeon]
MSVNVTRMELLRLKRLLGIAERAKSLLEEKRTILAMEILSTISRARGLIDEMEVKLRRAYQSFSLAEATMGRSGLLGLAIKTPIRFKVEIDRRKIMGVETPIFNLVEETEKERRAPYSLIGTTTYLDEAVSMMEDTVKVMVKVAEIEATVKALAAELEKIKRRVNALEHIVIPRLRRDIAFIEFRLEEMEREHLFRIERIVSEQQS